MSILSDEVAIWDESVAIEVQIEVFYHTDSANCFLGVVFPVIWRPFIVWITGGRLLFLSPQLSLRESWDVLD